MVSVVPIARAMFDRCVVARVGWRQMMVLIFTPSRTGTITFDACRGIDQRAAALFRSSSRTAAPAASAAAVSYERRDGTPCG